MEWSLLRCCDSNHFTMFIASMVCISSWVMSQIINVKCSTVPIFLMLLIKIVFLLDWLIGWKHRSFEIVVLSESIRFDGFIVHVQRILKIDAMLCDDFIAVLYRTHLQMLSKCNNESITYQHGPMDRPFWLSYLWWNSLLFTPSILSWSILIRTSERCSIRTISFMKS